MKKYVSFFLFIIFGSVSYGQISPIQKDSIFKLVSQNKIDELEALDYLIGNYYVYNEMDSVDFYCNKLHIAAKRLDQDKYFGNINYYLADKYTFWGEYDKATLYIQQAIEQHKQNNLKKSLIKDYNLLARIYTKNQKPKDFEYAFKALKISEEIKDTTAIINSLHILALFYADRKNYPMKNEYLERIYKLTSSGKTSLRPSEKYRLLTVYYLQKNKDSALYYLRKAIKYDEQISCSRYIAYDYYFLGEIYYFFDLGLIDAEKYYQKSLHLSRKVFKPLVGTLLSVIARTNYKNKQYHKAIVYAKESYNALIKEHDWDSLEDTSNILYKSYYMLKQYDSAYFYNNKTLLYRDSLFNKRIELASLEYNAQYESEKKQLQIEKLQLKQEKDNLTKNLLIGGLLITLFGLMFVTRYFLLRRKKNKLEKELLNSEKEKIEQDLQHKTRELTSQALMMLQKNKLLEEILITLSSIKSIGNETYKEITNLKRKLKHSMHSEKDWELFRQYFEQINKNFFTRLKSINDSITPSELKLAALIKLRFSIKESASLLHISEGSVKTARYQLRKKIGLKRGDNLYNYLNDI
jgi:DNA-binding CsgD family transcriptional regulator